MITTIEDAVKYIESNDDGVLFCSPSEDGASMINCRKILFSCSRCGLYPICDIDGKITLSREVEKYLEANKLHPELFL